MTLQAILLWEIVPFTAMEQHVYKSGRRLTVDQAAQAAAYCLDSSSTAQLAPPRPEAAAQPQSAEDVAMHHANLASKH